MDGILLVNKPSGWTSYDVCNFVKKRFKIKKVGHTGTLDPQATGVLVLLLGKYTKLSASLMSEDKEYSGIILLGKVTDSQDIDGKLLEQNTYENITENMLFEVLNNFKGEIQQIPPMMSAIKQKGQRLYKLARAGKTVQREARTVYISEFTINKIELPEIFFNIVVSKGTYVRTIAHDIGNSLGCGACLSSLCRRRNGRYSLENCISIEQLKQIEDNDELKRIILE